MGIAAIVLGALALLCAVGGAFTTMVPGLGALLSFSGPVFALVGIVLGGVGISRGREEGSETGTAIAGLVLSIIAFFPAFFVAISCGVCNVMCTEDMLRGQRATPWITDSGVTLIVPSVPPPDPNVPPDPIPSPDPPVDPTAPPPAFPPPPPP
jgi:hypothetical protein